MPGNSEIVIDQETAEIVFSFMRLDVHTVSQTFQDAYVNDSIREMMIGLFEQIVMRIDSYISYLKTKNWIPYPPIYPHTNPGVNDKIAVNEVYLLWNHLQSRYINVRKTQMYAELTTDLDFRAVLTSGLRVLNQQESIIEDKLLYLGVTLPKPYSPLKPVFKAQEPVENKFMFNDLLKGMQDALVLHGAAIQDIIINDDMRKFFLDFAMQEVNMIDKMLKYGRLKSWVNLIPSVSIDS